MPVTGPEQAAADGAELDLDRPRAPTRDGEARRADRNGAHRLLAFDLDAALRRQGELSVTGCTPSTGDLDGRLSTGFHGDGSAYEGHVAPTRHRRRGGRSEEH